MDTKTLLEKIGNTHPRVASLALRLLRKIPSVRRKLQRLIDKEFTSMAKGLESSLKPYQGVSTTFSTIPKKGIHRDTILKELTRLKSLEEDRWKDGFVSGAVYHGDDEHIDFLNKVYALNSQSNPLHAEVWPSITKYEAEIVSMTANMLGADMNPEVSASEKICGTVSSGGTESILLAMKAYRDRARDVKGITKPEMLLPVTAHAAFDKASQYFNIRIRRIPVDSNSTADPKEARKAITRNTIVMVGSAPSFPHGTIDPIRELSEIALERKIGFHTDACLGGFILPWAEKLGYDIPPFDFRLPGVTSISVDTHKYGFAAKGTSVILYRGYALRHYQFYKTADWPGGLYFSPTFAGSRPGGLSAACWAAMLSMGEEGYLKATEKIMKTADEIQRGISEIPDLHIVGKPLFDIAFGSKTINIYNVLDFMKKKRWSLNGLHRPPCIHLCLTLRHTADGFATRFINDLKAAVDHVKANPEEQGNMAPVYGMAATFPDQGIVNDLLDRYIDLLYKV